MLTRAQELDGNATVHNLRVQAMYPLGRRAEAIALLDEMIRNDPGHPGTTTRWRFAGWQSWTSRLPRQFRRDGRQDRRSRYRAVAEAGLAALRQHGERAMSDAMAALDRQYFERGEALALGRGHRLRAMVGNWREAVPLLRISFDRHEERLIGVKYHPAFWPIRDRPEYKQILAALGLPTERAGMTGEIVPMRPIAGSETNSRSRAGAGSPPSSVAT